MYFGVLWLQCVLQGSRQAPSAHLISTHCPQPHHYSKLSRLGMGQAQNPAPKFSFPSSSTGAVLLAARAAELPLLIHLHSVAASTS